MRPTSYRAVHRGKSGARNAKLLQRPVHWQMRLFDQPDDFQLFGSDTSLSFLAVSIRDHAYGMARPSVRRSRLAEETQQEGLHMKVSVLGIDLGKNICSIVHASSGRNAT
jgi:hypothetical protein